MSKNLLKSALIKPRAWGWLLVIGVLRGCKSLPQGIRWACGRTLGRLTAWFLPRRTAVMNTNIRLCFPEMSGEQRAELIRKHYEQLGIGVLEIGEAWWGDKDLLKHSVTIQGERYLREAQASGRGILMISGHTTQLDLLGVFLSLYCDYYAIIRPQKSAFLNEYADSKRTYVQGVLYQHELKRCCRLLKSGKIVVYFPDQDYGRKHSVFAPFFGVNAASVIATEKLARMTNAAVLPVVLVRDESEKGYRLIFKPLLDPFPAETPVASATAVNQAIEGMINEAPEQYLWGHRRFKNRPPGEPPVYS